MKKTCSVRIAFIFLVIMLSIYASSAWGADRGPIYSGESEIDIDLSNSAGVGVDGPTLDIPDEISADQGDLVSVPIIFTSNGNSIASTAFSIDYDETCLSFDPADNNLDGIPDAITCSAPAAFAALVTFDGSDTDGELDFAFFDFAPPLSALPDGTLCMMQYTVTCDAPTVPVIVPINFATEPSCSFGDTDNNNVPGTCDNGSIRIEPCSVDFLDVQPGFWAEDYIEALYCEGITTGCTQNPLNYCPFNNVTRQAMAAFIIRALYGETFEYTLTPYFTDVTDANLFFKYIQKMKDEEITTGCTATEYCPMNNVTRQAMAAFIIRALFGETFTYTETPYFTDVPDTSQFFKYIQKMKDEGITTGCTATEYCPLNNVTRAAMAAFLARAFLGMP